MQEFNVTQRAAFCVFSGKGVNELRLYLAELMAHVQAEEDTGDNETDYDDEALQTTYVDRPESRVPPFVLRTSMPHTGPQREPNINTEIGAPLPVTISGPSSALLPLPIHEDTNPSSIATTPSPTVRPRSNDGSVNSSQGHGSSGHRFGEMPFVEQPPPSPPVSPQPERVYVYGRSTGSVGVGPLSNTHNQGASVNANGRSNSQTSDTASDRSAGTNDSLPSNGAGFFSNYPGAQVAAGSATSVDGAGVGLHARHGQIVGGAHTPDLVFAELGHGRGTGAAAAAFGSGSGSGLGACKLESSVSNETVRPRHATGSMPMFGATYGAGEASSSNSNAGAAQDQNTLWNRNERERRHSAQHNPSSPIPYLSPTTRELQTSVHSAMSGSSATSTYSHPSHGGALPVPNASLLGPTHPQPPSQNNTSGPGTPPFSHPHIHANTHTYSQYSHVAVIDERGRSMRRSFKNTLNAAEHYASTFFFGRSGSAPSGSSSSSVTGTSGATEIIGGSGSGSGAGAGAGANGHDRGRESSGRG